MRLAPGFMLNKAVMLYLGQYIPLLNNPMRVQCLSLQYGMQSSQLTTCTCSLVSVKQEQVRVFCYSNKKLTRLQQSNFSIFGRHQTEFARCQLRISQVELISLAYFLPKTTLPFLFLHDHGFFTIPVFPKVVYHGIKCF